MRVLRFVVKEMWQLGRDWRLWPVLLLTPVSQMILFGYAVTTEVKHVRAAVCDLDHTQRSREMAERVFNSEYFDYAGTRYDLASTDQMLRSGDAALILVIPQGLAAALEADHPVAVEIVADGSDVVTASIAEANMQREILSQFNNPSDVHPPVTGGAAPIEAHIQVWYNPNLLSSNFVVPGIICLLVGLVSTILAALAVVKEREIGTIEQLIVSPLRPVEIVLGKLIPFLLIGYLDFAIILTANSVVLHVPMRGSLFVMTILSGIFLVGYISAGLVISTVAKNQQQAMMIVFFYLFPNAVITGFMYPIENMPLLFKDASLLLPMRYFLVITRDFFLRGSDPMALMDQIVPMTLVSTATFIIACLRFRKRLD